VQLQTYYARVTPSAKLARADNIIRIFMETKKVVTIIIFSVGCLICLILGFIGDRKRIQGLVQHSIHGKVRRIDYCPRDFWRVVYEQDDNLWKEFLFKSVNFPKENNLEHV
jgi:hypothetical protein